MTGRRTREWLRIRPRSTSASWVLSIALLCGAVEVADAQYLVWTVKTSGKYPVVGSVENGRLYAGCDDGNAYALDALTGRELWRFKTGGQVFTPKLANGVVYFGSVDKHLYAVSAETGQELWRFAAGDRLGAGVAVADGVLYFCDGGNFLHSSASTLYAADAASGKELWRLQIPGGLLYEPVVDEDIVYCASFDGKLHALDAKQGRELWTFAGRSSILTLTPVTGVAAGEGLIYFGCYDGTVYAVNAKTGQGVWTFTPENVAAWSGHPSYSDGFVYCGSPNGKLYQVSAQTGEGGRVWLVSELQVTSSVHAPFAHAPSRGPVNSPLVVGDVAYFGTRGPLFAVDIGRPQKRACQLAEMWQFKTGTWVTTTPILSDCFVYFANTTGEIFCVADLQRIGTAQHLDLLLDALNKGGYDFESNACLALGRWSDEQSVRRLIDALKSETGSHASAYAALALGSLGCAAREAVPSLVASFPAARIEYPAVTVLGGATVGQDEVPRFVAELSARMGRYAQQETTFRMPPLKPERREGYTLRLKYTIEFRRQALIVDAGAYALSRITGEDLGPDRAAWQEWWGRNRGKYE